MRVAHEYDNCPAKIEILHLQNWETQQNNKLGKLTEAVQELCEHEARRAGAEGMLKWIIGLVGVSGLASIISVIVGVVK